MPKKKKIFCLYLFLLILFYSFIYVEAKESKKVGQSFSLKFENGLLTVEAKDVSFNEILRALGQKTGTEFITLTPLISDELFSISFSDLTFSEALERLLKGFNYALIYGEDNIVKVFILDSKGIYQGKKGHLELVVQRMSEEPNSAVKTRLISEVKPKVLMNIQEGEPAQLSSLTEECLEVVFPRMDNSGKSLFNQSIIEQIRKIIGMGQCSHLWDQMLSGLVTIQDDKVTEMLIDFARSGGTVELRTKATEVLWRNTAKSEFKNANGVDALLMLTTSSDEEVRIMAKQAIEDYQRYKSRLQSIEKRARDDR